MSLSYSQNFDSVTPPSPPSGWNLSGSWNTVSSTFRSTPYSMQFQGTGSATYYAIYGTGDGSGSSRATIDVSTWVRLGSTTGYTQVGLTFRGASGTAGPTPSYYWLALVSAGGTHSLELDRVLTGTRVNIADVTLSGSFSSGVWYKLQVAGSFGGGSANSFNCYLIRETDGFYLTSSGTWSATPQAAIASTNNDLTTGEYAGFAAVRPNFAVAQYDDFLYTSDSGGIWNVSGTTSLVMSAVEVETTNMLASLSGAVAFTDLATQVRIPGVSTYAVDATTPLLVTDLGSEAATRVLGASTPLVLSDLGSDTVTSAGPVTYNVSASTPLAFAPTASTAGIGALSASHVLTFTDVATVTSINPVRVSATTPLVLSGDAAEVVHRIVALAATTPLVLSDRADEDAWRTLVQSVVTTIALSDAAAPGTRLTIGATAATPLVLSDVASVQAARVLGVLASTPLVLSGATSTTQVSTYSLSAATTIAFAGDVGVGSSRGISAITQVLLTDLAREVGVFVRSGSDTLAIVGSGGPGRVINVSAVSSFGVTGPGAPQGTWYSGSTSDALVLTSTALAASGGLPASSMLSLVDVGVASLDPPGGDVSGGVPTLVASGLSDLPFSCQETSDGTRLLANGIDPVMRWDPDAGSVVPAGVESPAVAPTIAPSGVGLMTGKRAAMVRFLDAQGRPGNPSPISAVVDLGWDGPIDGLTISLGVATIRSDGHGLSPGDVVTVLGTGLCDGPRAIGYADAHTFTVASSVSEGSWAAGGYWVKGAALLTYTVPLPSSDAVARVQVLRNLDAAGEAWYVDVDSAVIATTYTSARLDDELAAREPVPLTGGDGRPYAHRYSPPPSHHSVIAAHSGVLFLCGHVRYRAGNVRLTSGSRSVTGVGARFVPSFAGRLLHTYGARPQEIESVASEAELVLREPYQGASNLYAAYAICPDRVQQRTLRWSEPDNPEAWPAWNSVALPDEDDAVVGAFSLGPHLYVVKEARVYKLVSQDIDQASLYHASNRGCVNMRCCCQAEGVAYMLDEAGIHAFDGGASKHISYPIQDVFHANGQSTTLQVDWDADRTLWHSVADPVRNTLRWFVTMSGERPLTTAICYDYRLERWWLERYPWPVSASVPGLGGCRRGLAGIECRRVVVLAEGRGDLVPGGGTLGGQVSGATFVTLSDASANFAAGLAGTPVGIVTGDGRYQVRIIATNTTQTLTVVEPWATIPAPGDAYVVGGVAWTWRSGWLNVEAEEDQTPSDVFMAFRKPSSRSLVDLRVYYDYGPDPRVGLTTSEDGVSTVAGRPQITFDLGHDRPTSGYAFTRMGIHTADLYSYSEQYLGLRLDGVQGPEDLARIYEVGVRGVNQE